MTKIRKILTAVALLVAATGAAQTNLPTKNINGRVVYYYEVPPKETIYSITRKFNVTRDELMRLNPSLIDGLRAGSTIIIAEVNNPDYEALDEKEEEIEEPADESAETEEQTEESTETEETDNNDPVDQEESDGKAPVEEPVNVTTRNNAPAQQPRIEAVTTTVETATAESAEAENSDIINVAVILPFMLDSEGITRNAQNQLNFYRGMLLALDGQPAGESKIRVVAIDSEGTAEKVQAFVASPEFSNMDYIIAPGDSLSIEIIADAADASGATVLNMFAVKNDAHRRHESVMQANIPHSEMYDAAIQGFIKNFRSKKTLFLNATDIPADKQSFVSQLNTELLKSGIPWEMVDYSGKLTAEQLADMPVRDYVFIPTSSSREALLKVLPALIEYKNARPEIDINLFGYPEWVVLRGDIKENLHRLNATVYSRFSTDLDGDDVKAVNQAYCQWFGSAPTPSFPDTMLLGYDTMAWLLKAVNSGIETPYKGLQNAFNIKEVKDGGDINTALFLITFDVEGNVTATTL